MGFTILNINASRIGKKEKLIDLLALINGKVPQWYVFRKLTS